MGARRIQLETNVIGIQTCQRCALADAIAHPRVHVDTSGEDVQLKAEAGLDLPDTDLPITEFPEIVMYFGGVGAAVYDRDNGFEL